MPLPDPPEQHIVGSAMVQWCIAALPLLLLGALVIELSQWHLTRQRLALAVQRTVDDTALSGGSIAMLSHHLKRHMPADLKMPMRLCITDPVKPLMSDFVDQSLSKQIGQAVIRHDHVTQQHLEALKRGWPQGRGPRSQKTIFEANRLTVQLVAKYQAKSAWVRQVIDPIAITLTHQAIMQSHRQQTPSACLSLN